MISQRVLKKFKQFQRDACLMRNNQRFQTRLSNRTNKQRWEKCQSLTKRPQDSAFVPRFYFHWCWLPPRLLALPKKKLLETEGITAVFVASRQTSSRRFTSWRRVVIVNHNHSGSYWGLFRSTKWWKFFPLPFFEYLLATRNIEIKKNKKNDNIVQRKNIIVIENFMIEEEI